ncbi:MAG: hypothetical protein NZO16_03145, partial [Deltaproteobacteria bacterium]|nr:hypothetical protein [Deltaproteobacteria bacterium]
MSLGSFEKLFFFLSFCAIALSLGDFLEKFAIGLFTKLWSFRGMLFFFISWEFSRLVGITVDWTEKTY